MEVEIVWLVRHFILIYHWVKLQDIVAHSHNSSFKGQWAHSLTWDLFHWGLLWTVKLMVHILQTLWDRTAVIYSNSQLTTLSNFIHLEDQLAAHSRSHSNHIETQDRLYKARLISKMLQLCQSPYLLRLIRFLNITNLQTKWTAWR